MQTNVFVELRATAQSRRTVSVRVYVACGMLVRASRSRKTEDKNYIPLVV